MIHEHSLPCDCKHLFSLFRMDGATTWGFNIGIPEDGEAKIICTKGTYRTKREAEIAALAFIAGIRFNLGLSD